MILICLYLAKIVSEQGLVIETDIMALLPEEEKNPLKQQALERISKQFSQRLIVLIGDLKEEHALNHANWLKEQLSNTPISSVIAIKQHLTANADTLKNTYSSLLPYRFQLLSRDHQNWFEDNYQQVADKALAQLINPFTPNLSRQLQQDPLFLLPAFLQDQQKDKRFAIRNGFLTLHNQEQVFVVFDIELQSSAFSLQTQDQVASLLTQLRRQLKQRSATAQMLSAGSVRYAHAGSTSARAEISSVGLGSLLAILILLISLFRSTRPLLFASVPLACGCLVAITIILAIYGEIHLFTLVFGASLVGVAIDYTLHYLCDYFRLGKYWTAENSIRQVLPGISMGLLTSSIGYGSLTLASFPGLQQIALFSVSGLITAYLTVVCLLPWLGKPSTRQSTPWLTLCESWLTLIQRLRHRNRNRYLLILLILVVIVIGLPRLHPNDNIRLLQETQPHLEAEQKQIQSILNNDATSQFFLVFASSKTELLNQLDDLCLKLEHAIEQGWLDQYQSICSQLPGPQRQQYNHQLVKKAFESTSGPIFQYLQQSASKEQVDNWQELLRQKPNDYTFDQWQANPMSQALRGLWLGELQGQFVTWVQLSGIHQMKNLSALASLSPNWIFINQVDDISQLFKRYRAVAVKILFGAYLLIVLILAWRYGLKGMLLILLAPVSSILLTLSILGLSGSLFNFFNIFALLVVLGIGIDYALFFKEAEQQAQTTTLLAIALSALTTLLAFGLLSLSKTPVIHSFGLTLLLGILFCFLLAPLVTIDKHHKKGITDE